MKNIIAGTQLIYICKWNWIILEGEAIIANI